MQILKPFDVQKRQFCSSHLTAHTGRVGSQAGRAGEMEHRGLVARGLPATVGGPGGPPPGQTPPLPVADRRCVGGFLAPSCSPDRGPGSGLSYGPLGKADAEGGPVPLSQKSNGPTGAPSAERTAFYTLGLLTYSWKCSIRTKVCSTWRTVEAMPRSLSHQV